MVKVKPVFTKYQLAESFSSAYGKSATISAAVNAFRKCGRWSVNLQVLEEYEFAPSSTTDALYVPKSDVLTSASNSSLATTEHFNCCNC